MENIPNVYIGVDVSKESLDIHFFPTGQIFKIGNEQREILDFIAKLAQYNIVRIGCESTGGYEQLLATLLWEQGLKLWIIEPRRIRGYIIATGCKSKTDKIDAKKIAEFVARNEPDYDIIRKTKTQNTLLSYINRKEDLTKTLAAEKTRLKHPVHESSAPNIKEFVNDIQRAIKKLDFLIQKLVEEDDELQLKVAILKSIPGIGYASAALFIAWIPELGKVNSHQIAALVGVCPYNNESGKYKGKRFIRGGRNVPRTALYMCALTGIKCNPDLKKFYEKLRESKKPFKVAIVAIMRKLILLANTLIRENRFYELRS